MKHIITYLIALLLLAPFTNGFAGQDTYIGDTAIYGGSTVSLKPNVLIIFDSSGSMGGNVPVEVCQPDNDSDSIEDNSDNCPNTSNTDQADTDNDGIGDVCDDNTTFPDSDGDGITDDTDNCRVTVNAGQADTDGDGVGDACEILTGAYDPDYNYTTLTSTAFCEDDGSSEDCQRDKVYRCVDGEWDQNGFCTEWDQVSNIDVDDVGCSDPRTALDATGYYVGNVRFRWNGSCRSTSGSRYHGTGNWIDWFNSTSDSDSTVDTGSTQICTTINESKNQIARNVVTDLIRTTDGVNFGVMRFYSSDDGSTFITRTVDGSNYTSDLKDMDEIHTGTTTNRDALIDVVNNIPAQDWTPLAESLYESMRYFTGGNSAFQSINYTSPIQASCQPNYVILITDGMSTRDRASVLQTICDDGDCDGDNNDPGSFTNDGSDYLDDVAWYLYNTDLSDEYTGVQNVKTYTIGFGLDGADADAVQLLKDAADNGQGAAPGEGKAYLASSYQSLTGAFSSIIGEVLNTSSAFVAPVVPTSPENKVYSGQRIYLGFFKPQTSGNWLGNLKKFGLNDSGEVIDKNGNDATDANGAFLPESVSYWSNSTDSGNVEEGGIGDILSNRNLSTNQRNIYTYTGTTSALIDTTNALTTSNTELSASQFAVATDTIKDNIINYVHGYDIYDEDVDLDVSEQRAWIMGDVLHSKPAIQSYNSYALTDETNTSLNKTVIYVGSNDGQLHAFSDADGAEMWSFVPPSVLPNLQNLGSNDIHEYFMDGSPVLYVYDYDKDGNIGTGPEQATGDVDPTSITDNGTNDKVILIVSMRRGGGIDTLSPTGSRGSYYALDVTNPTTPQFLWEFDSTTVDGSGNLIFGELGESWSEPVIGKVRLNGTDRMVAFIAAGYDNNEDLRFGNNQQFPDTTTATTSTVLSTADAGNISNVGTSAQVNPKGRGIYVLELATINSSTGALSFHTTPHKLWEYVNDANNPTGHNPSYSFATEIAPLDYDFDGYIDRLYAGDTGGNMWRFDISSKESTTPWNGTKVFSANPSNITNSVENPATNGRKSFFRPSVVQEAGYVGVYFGSGDRVHPLNQAVIDRMYAFYDRNSTATKSEANLVNVTEDNLQAANPTSDPADLSSCTLTNTSVGCTLKNLYDTQYYGWFIKLDQAAGEKVLANPLVFNKVAYFTTFTPNVATTDPCLSGNLGVGKLYAVDYKTGEAVFNFDTTNDVATDDDYASGENERAKGGGSGDILRRSDRSKTIGSGIPSGPVIIVREDGTSSALVGCGGGLCGGETDDGGTTIPMYWIME
jgi:type IV pilus assembly protein PilY1